MKRTIKIYQTPPKALDGTLAIVPYGLYLNRQLQKANPGELLEFRVEWRRETFTLLHKAKLKVNSSAFTLMLKMIYGEFMTWSKLSEQWRAECILEGLGKDAFDTDTVLLLWLKPCQQKKERNRV